MPTCFCTTDNGTEMVWDGTEFHDGKPYSLHRCPNCKNEELVEKDDCPV